MAEKGLYERDKGLERTRKVWAAVGRLLEGWQWVWKGLQEEVNAVWAKERSKKAWDSGVLTVWSLDRDWDPNRRIVASKGVGLWVHERWVLEVTEVGRGLSDLATRPDGLEGTGNTRFGLECIGNGGKGI